MKITSGFAILDVKDGREGLRKRLAESNADIPVTLTGVISGLWNNDDGQSQEFQLDVTSVTIAEVSEDAL